VEQQNAELNSHTYVYEPDKSFKGMTVRSGMSEKMFYCPPPLINAISRLIE